MEQDMYEELNDIEKQQYINIGITINALRKEYRHNQEIEIRFGDKNPNPKEGFKCFFPIDMYNEKMYRHIRELAIAYHNNKKEDEDKKEVLLYFYVGGKFVGSHELYYDQEMVEELKGPKK